MRIRKILYCVFLISLSFTLLCRAQVSTVTTAPKEVEAGQSFMVDLRVSKGSIGGFGKLELDVPEGYAAEQVDVNGSSFGTSGTKVKFVWMAMPADSVFSVRYKLTPLVRGQGVLMIGGRLIYALDGEPRKHIISPVPIAVGVGIEAVSAFMSGAPDSVLMRFIANSKPTLETFNEKRNGDSLSAGKNKPTNGGPADLKGSDKKLKSTLGETPNRGASGAIAESAGQEGAYGNSMSSNPESVREIDNRKGSVSKKNRNDSPDVVRGNQKKSGSEPNQVMNENRFGTGDQAVLLRPRKREEVRTPDDKSLYIIPGVIFKVQVAAFKKRVLSAQEVAALYQISEALTMEKDDGMLKYVTSEYTLYRSAKTKANGLRETTSAPGPFVVPYLNGKRVNISKVLSTESE